MKTLMKPSATNLVLFYLGSFVFLSEDKNEGLNAPSYLFNHGVKLN